jgi:hypothetical protein
VDDYLPSAKSEEAPEQLKLDSGRPAAKGGAAGERKGF